jgi:hypothetical protein
MATHNKRRRYRKQFWFQLDLNKPDEQKIASRIGDLKRERTFSKTIRDGIRLIWDLQKGRVEVLQELFPWVLEQQSDTSSETAIEKVTSTTEDLMRQHIERLESLILQQGATPIADGIKPSAVALSRTGSPSIDDIQLEVKHATNSENNNASWNFMIASALQIYGDYDNLPPQVIDYGLRTGRIPADRVKRKTAPQSPKGTSSNENPQKIANADIVLNEPNFDDLDDLL